MPSRAEVRAVLVRVLCSDSDLNAFCGDHFPEVYARFTGGMDRVAKLNELLDRAELGRILDKLREAYPDFALAHAAAPEGGHDNAPAPGEAPNAGQPSPHYPDEATRSLGMQIEQARARKRALEKIRADTAEIDREIRELRRQLREGGQLRAGDSLGDGRYLLLQRLGKGGFAVVWEAYDNDRRERVAVKVLHGELASDTIRRERFFRGARIMAELDDRAIVRVLDPRAEEGGTHYFIMELLTGGDLRKAVLGGQLGGPDILAAILPIGEALARAHAKGLIHRDIKPANLLLDPSGAIRLTDFDLVGGGDTTGGTRTGAIGTWIYAAPELMHHPQDADARADVYGLGMTIAFGLHGAELPMDVVKDAAKFIDALRCGEPVKAVLKQAVEWKPEGRFANAGDFCEALRKALVPPPAAPESAPDVEAHKQEPRKAAAPLPAKNASKPERAGVAGPAARTVWMRIVPTVVAVAVGAAIGVWRGCGTRPEDPEQDTTAASARGEPPKPVEPEVQPAVASGSPAPAPAGSAPAASGLIALADAAPMRFMSLPGGKFQMGSPTSEADRDTDETQHPAEVGPFEIAIHEVTQKQWFTLMRTKPFDCDYGCGDDLPAQKISWTEAVKFMNALTDRENTGRPERDKRTRCYDDKTWAWERNCTGYRLPTEAEWEYAARAGTKTAYSSGNDSKELCKYANGADLARKRKYPGLTVNTQCDDKYPNLAPVGKLEPNPWGLYDMHGNVWEWVWDWYGPYPTAAPLGYAGVDGGSGRVLRGGSFDNVPRGLRSSDRDWSRPTLASVLRGFRCARGSPPSH